ncbi:Conserved_hypothetical protein [Hexamita inflata]|uniref:Uncharacterized protein n=1 Tax=Hexamita inflata TaxID=28002 RepID=A0AA86UQV3_9EUKA|nr:Conserved hypothetical protein [Hexamita inflata]
MILIILTNQGSTVQIRRPRSVSDCYSELTTVVLKEGQKQVCVRLISNNNSNCSLLPNGINVSVKLDKLGTLFTPKGYFNDFNYSTTKELCISCTDPLCAANNYQQSTSASVTISSYGIRANISVGVVIREQLNLVNCVQKSYVKVFKTKVQSVAEISDYCWQLLTTNSYVLLNSTTSAQFQDKFQEFTYGAGSPMTFDVVGQSFIFSLANPLSYEIFDQSNFVKLSMKMFIRLSNTVNVVTCNSSEMQIDGLPPGFASLRLRLNPDNFQLSGIPSPVGIIYSQQAALQHFDAFHTKLKIEYANKAFFFDSTDKITYEPGQTQLFTCTTTTCKSDMKYVFDNANSIVSSSILISIKSASVILYMVAETVSNIYEGCYQGFHLNYNTHFTWFDLIINSQTQTCGVIDQTNYILSLNCKNSSVFTQIQQFNYFLNKNQDLINQSFFLTLEMRDMIRKSQTTTLFIKSDSVVIDYVNMIKLVDYDTTGFINQQLIILGVCMIAAIITALLAPLIEYLNERRIQRKKNKLVLKRFNEQELE